MKPLKKLSLLFFIPLSALAQQPAPQLGKDPIPAVVKAMTLEEKAKLVVGMGFKIPGMTADNKDKPGNSPATSSADNKPGNSTASSSADNKDKPGGLPGINLPSPDPEGESIPDKVPGAAGRTHPIPRLGIPSITVTDGPAGIRIEPIRNGDSTHTYYATAFPVATLLASSWDTSLVEKVGAAFGNEVHEYGSDILLGPGMNIHRNPLGGRNFEYYSEDPLIAGTMAAAMVEGIQSQGVGTSIKHFAGNNQETDRMTVNTLASQRALREIYLKGFQIAVQHGHPWTVMSSYNLLNGTYTSQRPDLLTTLLREEWGFKGFVMTDWFGGDDPVAQMKAGNDLIMPGNPEQSQKIVAAVNNGQLDIHQLDKNVTRILGIILRSPEFKKYPYTSHPDLKGHAAIVRAAAAEGMVLLKNNDKALPLTNARQIALFGNNSYDNIAGGTGSGDVNKLYSVSLYQGLGAAGFMLDKTMADNYTQYLAAAKANQPKGIMTILNPPPPPGEMDISTDHINQFADQADIAVLTIGRNAGEGKDRKLENDYYLSTTEKAMIHSLSTAFHTKGKKLVVVLNIGGVIEIASWRDQADAILLAWQPGLEGGNSIADILAGKTNPSGRLASSFPIDYKDVPSADNFPGKESPEKATKGFFGMPMIPAEVEYKEGIYVGYRYYSTFHVKTAYPFGYGLSYTQFKYSAIQAAQNEDKTSISLTITNSGSTAGKEVAEIYVTAPAGNLDKPAKELKAFAKTKLLQPGESQTLHFTLSAADLASFDPKASAWIATAGSYNIQAGANAEQNISTATIVWPATTIVQKVNQILAPPFPIDSLKP